MAYLFDQNFKHLRRDGMERCAFVVNGDPLALFESVCKLCSSTPDAPVGVWGARRAAKLVPGSDPLKQLHAARVDGKKLEPAP